MGSVNTQSISLSQPARPGVQFGRQVNREELAWLLVKAPTNLKPNLSFAYDMSLQEFENFASQGPMKMMKNGREIVEDSIRLMTHLRQQGLPAQDQPVYFVMKGQLPPIDTDRPININLVEVLKQHIRGPIKFVLKGLGLNTDALPDTPPPANGYTREDARAAMKALADSTSARPVNEMMVLMNILLNRTRREDLIPLDSGRFAFRMTLPGEDVAA